MEKSEGHFGDRAKLLLDLLAWGDEALKLGDLLARVTEAPTGVQALERMVEVHATYSPRIDALARILEAHQCQDPAVAPQLIGISRPAGSRRGSLRLRAALRLPSSRRAAGAAAPGGNQLLSEGVGRDLWRFAAVNGWFILLIPTSL